MKDEKSVNKKTSYSRNFDRYECGGQLIPAY